MPDEEFDPYFHDEPVVAYCVFDAVKREWCDVPPDDSDA